MGPHSPLDLSSRIKFSTCYAHHLQVSHLAYLDDPFLGTYCSTLFVSIRVHSENIWWVLVSDRAGVSHTRRCTYTHCGLTIQTEYNILLSNSLTCLSGCLTLALGRS